MLMTKTTTFGTANDDKEVGIIITLDFKCRSLFLYRVGESEVSMIIVTSKVRYIFFFF